MNPKQKKQSSADSTPAAKTTIDSASPSDSVIARTSEPWCSRFSVGDMIVENFGNGTPRFGIILSIHKDNTFAVRFADGEDYAFASHCLPYSHWLELVRERLD